MTGYTVGAFGLDAEALRLIAALGYQVNDLDSISGVPGGGPANVSFDYGDGTSDDDTVLAYQLGAGVGFTGMPNVVIDLGYRYFATTDFTPEDPLSFTIGICNIVVGVRFDF